MKYYKYMERKYLQDFINGRSIRIGTLHDFRKTESYGEEIGDSREGSREVFSDEPVISSDIPESIPPIVNSIFSGFENVKRGMIFDCIITKEEEADDVYMFSISTHFEVSTMVDLGYDACVEITDLEKFIAGITQKLYKKKLSTGGFHRGRCIYGDRRTNSREQEKIPPWSLKEKKHEYQKEYRIAWEPLTDPIEPVNISCTALKKYLAIKYLIT